jgi:hypothetical protein
MKCPRCGTGSLWLIRRGNISTYDCKKPACTYQRVCEGRVCTFHTVFQGDQGTGEPIEAPTSLRRRRKGEPRRRDAQKVVA